MMEGQTSLSHGNAHEIKGNLRLVAPLRKLGRKPISDNPKLVAEAKRRREAFLAYMRRHGLQSTEWARKAGISQRTIGNYLANPPRCNFLTDAVLRALVDASPGTLDELLGYHSAPPPKVPANDDRMIRMLGELSEVMSDLTEELARARRRARSFPD
jgi:hypothetical protein